MTNIPQGFELERTHAYLIAKRNFYGADSAIGHRCSNIVEQLENHRNATGDQKAALEKSIAQQMADLERLCAAVNAER